MDQSSFVTAAPGPYSLLLPREIIFGWGVRTRLGELAGVLGKRVLLVTGGRSLQQSGLLKEILDNLNAAGLQVELVGQIVSEPAIEDVDELTASMLRAQAGAGDVVIGIGGGAVLDLAKAGAAMITNARGRSVREFLEGVGQGATITTAPLPFIAVPTTAGTGTEATKNAVISVSDPACKKSLRSPLMVPAVALVDPELTMSCPFEITAHSGMDAITQLLESYISHRANRVTRALCLDGLQGIPTALLQATKPGNAAQARASRERMSYAALMSGMALANSGLGFAHGVAAALGALCNIPHGLACATLLPTALRVNWNCVPEADWQRLAMAMRDESDRSPVVGQQVDDMVCLLHRSLGISARCGRSL